MVRVSGMVTVRGEQILVGLLREWATTGTSSHVREHARRRADFQTICTGDVQGISLAGTCHPAGSRLHAEVVRPKRKVR
jgi:hypothetical protein